MKSFLSLGTNLGNREEYLELARNYLHNPPITKLVHSSQIINTPAMDFLDQPDFLNQVLEIETELAPLDLLDFTQSIEQKIGRVKRFDKGPREIDIDILLYEGIERMVNDRLILPHHSIESRPFIGELLESIY
ncbi:2-amino-4-hydroxy-6-hydroxymethyldihydropteridine diphosphokinase [Leptospira sp. GIMC2001]|uniref:2-amino-4-hydroxy-6- hydroxymethyldihydropteridine diphosphokinase n=1 Tax=Leptospira sp. GIMC2001 TaxID=1513297 RepID=UPI00234A65D7|nr:2-amino-4-hydroxy-6-hydroxymethyldihydropteridine diphosphokinase [Leptospira sp. GIMC2001]WCL49249.1 2-amino-4-hydroxy-6-hydroxymethyldihydropteridine diphosphokinase [Leptospira sp. GIMC2001]